MKLTTILQTPGIHVWNFRSDTPLDSISDAHRRFQSYLQQGKYAKLTATARGAIMTDVKTYTCEPVLIIEVK